MTGRDLLHVLARESLVERFTLQRYTPRSGAARRAIAEGADPAPLLLDVGLYASHETVDSVALNNWLDSRRLREDEVLAVASPVLLTAGIHRHLLLLDFAVAPSPSAQSELEHFLAYCEWSGWLLMSGASYHFIGNRPLSLGEWRLAMARAQLIPGIDVRYMAHALYNDVGAARFTACPLKPTVPFVVATLGDVLFGGPSAAAPR